MNKNLQTFLTPYPASYAATEAAEFLIIRQEGKDFLAVSGEPAVLAAFDGTGTEYGKSCPLTHENRCAIQQYLPFARPRAMGRKVITFGLGDRLGLAGTAHLTAMEPYCALPILAQQSLRELTLTGRSFSDVIDAAVWSVIRAGWRRGFGADGDHLQRIPDVKQALASGCSMITLDCSEVLRLIPGEADLLKTQFYEIPQARRMEETYLGRTWELPSLCLAYTPESLMQTAVCYYGALDLAQQADALIKQAGRPVDLEISLDETAFTTSTQAHFFFANELALRGIDVCNIAPRFVGEFQKGVDYIGSPAAFHDDYARHQAVAAHFDHKLSVHSGSDKFSIFPAIGELSCRYHVKTAGTNWLEAVRILAKAEPALYRRLHRFALENFDGARRYYHVQADAARIRPLDTAADAQLPDYLEQNDSRQLMHITYGFILQDKLLRPLLFEALTRHREAYAGALITHIRRHADALGIPPYVENGADTIMR